VPCRGKIEAYSRSDFLTVVGVRPGNGRAWYRALPKTQPAEQTEFRTKTGKPFSYRVQSRATVWIERDGRTVNQSLGKSNFSQVYDMMRRNSVNCPWDLNVEAVRKGESQVRGPSYVRAILQDERITQERLPG